jgi:hypothetical protein
MRPREVRGAEPKEAMRTRGTVCRKRRGRLLGVAIAMSALGPMPASADVELRWPAFEDAAAVVIERGLDDQSMVPIARIDGKATAYRDETPLDAPRLCYRVQAVGAAEQAGPVLERCLSRPAGVSALPPVGAAGGEEDAPPGQSPKRWRGLEGWYQVVPAPAKAETAAPTSPAGQGSP